MSADATVLLVEDDAALRRSLSATLKAAGYKLVEAQDLSGATRALAHFRPALVLLDLGLPDGDGLAFITTLRQSALTPIVVITARDAEAIKVDALDRGADDYITKPFGVDELLARMRAALRHAVQAAGSTPLVRTGDVEIDLAKRVVKVRGAVIDLTPKEYNILAVLAARVGQVVRHAELLKIVWGSKRADIQYLRVYVSQLRTKLELDPSAPKYLISEPAVGYRFADLPRSP